MIRRPPRSTRTDTLFPYTTLFRSSHLGDMRALFDGLPLDRMNTSMTINATAPWLLALYVAAAESQGVARAALSGTVQNDIIKEYRSEEHTSELQSLMRISYAVFCLQKKINSIEKVTSQIRTK